MHFRHLILSNKSHENFRNFFKSFTEKKVHLKLNFQIGDAVIPEDVVPTEDFVTAEDAAVNSEDAALDSKKQELSFCTFFSFCTALRKPFGLYR